MKVEKIGILVVLGVLVWLESKRIVEEQKEGFCGGGGCSGGHGGGGHGGHGGGGTHGMRYGGGSGGGGGWYSGWFTGWNPVWIDYGFPSYWWYVEPDCNLIGCPRGASCINPPFGSPFCAVRRRQLQEQRMFL